MLQDYINDKEVIIVGIGIGQKSDRNGFYYANTNSNCLWNVIYRLKWIRKIPQNARDFEKIMSTSRFGFTDLVKDHSGRDNKVLTKYYKPVNGKIIINSKYLINEEQLEIDKRNLISKIKRTKYIILNGRFITKILFGTDKIEYGFIENKDLLESTGLEKSRVLFSRNSIIRDNNKREEIENKLIALYSKIEQ